MDGFIKITDKKILEKAIKILQKGFKKTRKSTGFVVSDETIKINKKKNKRLWNTIKVIQEVKKEL